jgi:hypothetical protein
MFAMWSLWRPAGAGLPIPARPTVFLPGEGVEEGLGTRGGRFRYLAGPVAAPASGAPAAREGRPRLPAYAGEDGSGGG